MRFPDDGVGWLVATVLAAALLWMAVRSARLRRRLQTKLRRLRRKLARRERMLARAASDLRTPLGGTLGWLRVLDTAGMPRSTEGPLRAATASAAAALELCEGALEPLESSGRSTANAVRRFEPRAVVDAVVELFSPEATARGLEFAIGLAPDLPPEVEADPAAFRRLASVIVIDAVHGAHDGRITVELTRAPNAPNSLRFVVTSPTKAEPESADRHRAGEGASRPAVPGLALRVGRRLASRLGGNLEVRTVPGAGCQVSAEVPVSPVIDARASEVTTTVRRIGARQDTTGGRVAAAALTPSDTDVLPRAPAGLPTLRFLVAVAEPLLRQRIGGAVQALGGRAVLVADGTAALETASPGTFDFVILDEELPDAEGLALAPRVALAAATFPEVVLATSAADAAERLRRHPKSRVTGLFRKPTTAAEAEATVRDLLRRAAPLSAEATPLAIPLLAPMEAAPALRSRP